ncbi:MAG: hypothetical protein L0Z50_05090 [Verrucomicrobiales bacterium]|nr:hypothetical protein [Verrucomicrobiales bacterium]
MNPMPDRPNSAGRRPCGLFIKIDFMRFATNSSLLLRRKISDSFRGILGTLSMGEEPEQMRWRAASAAVLATAGMRQLLTAEGLRACLKWIAARAPERVVLVHNQ